MSTIVIALSGGVDSSVAAALLKQQGHAVIGMMLRLWSEPDREECNRCCSPDAMVLARRVAGILDIPFYVLDAKQVFQQTVVQSFLDGYASGETPNPCLVCNRLIRWGFLLERAFDMGAEALATGHYVRLRKDACGKLELLRGTDRKKDQAYVLHMLTQEKLQKSLFPVGDYTKEEVRELARKFNLPSARRADSQDLCFLGGEDYRDFIRRNVPGVVRPGLVVDLNGKVLGEHAGLPFYTIGQRKGLGVPSRVPLYVIAKNTKDNALVIGKLEELGSLSCTLVDMNWISGEVPRVPFQAEVKTRYTAREVRAEVIPTDCGKRATIRFLEKVRDITPGQAGVVFAGEVVLGGGTITQVAHSYNSV